MSNSLKFTEAGHVKLSVVAEEGSTGAEELVVRVSDTGIGIPAEMHEDIFQSFKQADAGVTRKYGGTGLGLAICRRLADALGGTIGVASEVGKGSTFTVRLPLDRPASGSEGHAADNDASALSSASRVPCHISIDIALRASGRVQVITRTPSWSVTSRWASLGCIGRSCHRSNCRSCGTSVVGRNRRGED
jgi:hypothetical protein